MTPPVAEAPVRVHAFVEAQAARTPHRVAVRRAAEAWTYAQLDARANRLAHHLRALGVTAEMPVGVLLRRTPELVAALLGVLKAGGAYVPLDPAYPAARLAFMARDAGVRVLVTEAALAGALPHGLDARIVVLDAPETAEALAARPATKPAERAEAASLAYVIYTSGSTGTPKGVQIEHRNAARVLRWLEGAVAEEDRAAAMAGTSVCFDVSVAELFGTLAWGGTVTLADNALGLAALGADEARLASMVPSAAAELLRMGAIPPHVRTLNLGGEPLPDALAQRLLAETGVTRVLNLYGPTEDATYSTCRVVTADDEIPVNVGRALDGTRAHVLDDALRPVPAGAEGEVWLGGEGVTRGYVARPGLTAERWLPDPFAETPGARMYRTGDLGRVLPNGELDVLGRVDHQVKIRGFRVELGEIEQVLARHPRVRDAAVVLREDRPGDRVLAAYVVAEDGDAPPAGALRELVRLHLPDYMVPDAVSVLDALPRLPNGKVDREGLPAPTGPREGGAPYRAPAPGDEARLAAIWAEVLGVERVGADDGFLALGGHSLRAAQVAARVREAFGVSLPMSAVFAMPTVAGLAALVAETRDAAGADAAPIPPAPAGEPVPLSFPQEAIWFFHALSPGMRSYNFQAALRWNGALDVPALERALGEIVRRHEVFRTTFEDRGAGPEQVVHAPWAVTLDAEDLSVLPADRREAELQRRLSEEFHRPFALDRLPLVRWRLFRMDEGKHVLAIVEHHLVHDGWSFGLCLRETVALYSAFARGLPSPLAEPPIQYGDWASWQRRWMDTPEAQAGLAYWIDQLRGAPPVLELPADRPRPTVMSFRGASVRVVLPPGLYRAAEAFSRERGVTLFMTLQAAFQSLLHRLTGEADFCVGTGVAARRRREMEGMIGMVVNTVPLRADFAGDPSFAEVLGRVRDTALAAYAHEEVPFGELVAALHPERNRVHLPVFQVAFSFHHAPYGELAVPGATLAVEEGLSNDSAKFDLQVIAIPRAHQTGGDETVTMIWEYASDLFDRATVESVVARYFALLEAALADPEHRVSGLPLLRREEEMEVAALSAPRGAPRPADGDDGALLHRRLEAVARARPTATALEYGGRRLAYAELNGRANRLARVLRAAGVGPEDRVGVCLERGPEMVVALVAILKAGGTFVPMDASYPAERLAFMRADAGVRVLVVADEVPAAFEGHPVHAVSLGRDAAAIDAQPDGDLPPHPVEDPAEGAYLIYTSGSTGTPKGSVLTHHGVQRVVRHGGYVEVGAGDAVAQTANFSFDAAVWEVWAPLLAGGRVVGIDRETTLDPAALADALDAGGVTVVFLTTALFHQVAVEAPRALDGRTVLFGGEKSDPNAVRAALKDGAPRRLLHMYGPSEGTVYASWHEVTDVPEGATAVPIGAPLACGRLFVLDGDLRPVPPGVAGELFVGGDGVTRGYLNRPALTAERFLPDAHSGVPGARLYRTGDRVRWRADGALEFVGRMDGQVKVRGYRVETGEIEIALRAHPGVAAAAVAAREDGPSGRHLAAWWVPADGHAPTAAELRASLAERLPSFMVPTAWGELFALPLTPNGKVDYRALPAPDAGAAVAAAYAPPVGVLEETIAAIWAEVLRVERVGRHDSFFDLGGHSLRATRITARMEEAGVPVPVSALFDHPTVAALAAEAERLAAATRDDDLASALAFLDGLSDEEAERLLNEAGEAVRSDG